MEMIQTRVETVKKQVLKRLSGHSGSWINTNWSDIVI